MFFLVKGRVGVYYGTKVVVVIEEGSYFGEIGCIMGGIRRAGVRALTVCELQALSRRNLNILLAEYPEVGDELKRVARERASAANKGKKSDKAGGGDADSLEEQVPSLVHKNEGRDNMPLPAGDSKERDDDKLCANLEGEIEAIVAAISKKLRHDIASSSTNSID